ncbi:DgyrCDS4726 [Dimorphilus gyrociliatus]|uniref:tubulin-glutamate carboxypeptidase n=1 Tax=Dimorphilus gyrociliatus TaxID=2664684 RepID=A0A7I8VHV8_9ANNE|nr:DgyrCDS4726 [Dimorphilus gyrociliatus]
MTEFRCGGLTFLANFDSANLARVEKVLRDEESEATNSIEVKADYEYQVWTKPDCGGTEYENGNRSWFHFGVRGGTMLKVIKITIMNLNKQGKLFAQGHAPLVKSGKKWERIRDRPTWQSVDNDFRLTFTHRFLNTAPTVYFAFCYPFSYLECQEMLESLDDRFREDNEIYYHRELLCRSIDGLRVDLLTISDYEGIHSELEPVFDEHLFPDGAKKRPRKFEKKRVFFVSSRVHPGETPSSFVFNGFLDLILRQNDERAKQLRRKYVFKLIPILNPDGVKMGHYRTDSRGANLNRYYLQPDFSLQPTIYAAKAVIRFHHDANSPDNQLSTCENKDFSTALQDLSSSSGSQKSDQENVALDRSKLLFSKTNSIASIERQTTLPVLNDTHSNLTIDKHSTSGVLEHINSHNKDNNQGGSLFINTGKINNDMEKKISGIAFYIDLHGHASKRGCFLYGNNLPDEEEQVKNILYAKLMAVNSAHFDFSACNFTEKNMYTRDKRDGLSKEGSGRVSIWKTFGITHSYTLECNYNSGKGLNAVPPAKGDDGRATPPPPASFPPKYTPTHYEEVGRALAVSALDIENSNPWPRIGYADIHALREILRRSIRASRGLPLPARKFGGPLKRNSINLGPVRTVNRNTSNSHSAPTKTTPVPPRTLLHVRSEPSMIPKHKTSVEIVSKSLMNNRRLKNDFKVQLKSKQLPPFRF